MRNTSLRELISCLNSKKLFCGRQYYRKKAEKEDKLDPEYESIQLTKSQGDQETIL